MAAFLCQHESDVQQAAASGRWPAALVEHAQTCRTCADVRMVTEAFATQPVEPASISRTDPAVLFARAREERRLAAEVQISRVATWTHVAVLLGVLAVALYFLPTPSIDWTALAAQWPADTFLLLPADSWTWAYAAGGFLMASLFVLSRWASQDA